MILMILMILRLLMKVHLMMTMDQMMRVIILLFLPNPDSHPVTYFIWSKAHRSFTPRLTIPDDRKLEVLVDLEPGCSELKRLYILIS